MKREAVNHPAHYGGQENPYEAIKVIEAWGLGFCLGNTVKYIARAEHKGASLQELIVSFGDLHIYRNHFDQVREQLSREPRPLPRLSMTLRNQSIDEFEFEDFVIADYNPHPGIKAPVAV